MLNHQPNGHRVEGKTLRRLLVNHPQSVNDQGLTESVEEIIVGRSGEIGWKVLGVKRMKKRILLGS